MDACAFADIVLSFPIGGLAILYVIAYLFDG